MRAQVMRRSTILIIVAGALAPVVPTTAAAQTTPPAAAPKLSITTERVHVSGGRASALTGQPWRVRVVLRPLVPGQTAVVRFYRNGRRVQAAQVPLAPSATGRSVFAVMPFTSGKPGRIVVRATHFATPQLPALKAKAVGVSVVTPSLRPGARGPAVRLLQGQLARLGYVVGAPGLYDARTARAVLAFRKVTGMARTEIATAEVFRRLARGGGVFRVRFPSHGKHVEADLSRQVIALIRGVQVERIYPVSSGKPSTPTIRGHFRVYLKAPGTNAKGMYMSSYFIRGYAIHGYPSVPVFPASHGCLRVPMSEAVSIFRWLNRGDIVDVYP
jgi:L,D-transpeptidase catalytic domain/Putative peptidoglycan binding domain